ncbi:MAG: class I SAM-dependent methyltransferase [Halodesulfurarchaeum sp.]
MANWDQRFREGSYPRDPDPAPILKAAVSWFPDGRALDIATGTGRNAVFLAEAGYTVDGLDKSRPGLEIARANAREHGVADRCSWIEADALEYAYPEAAYDVITIRSFQIMERITDIKAALAPGGVLYYQPHLRTSEDLDYGPSPRHRVGANELLRACLDLTVLHYREFRSGDPEHRGAHAQVIARNTIGHTQSHPPIEGFGD